MGGDQIGKSHHQSMHSSLIQHPYDHLLFLSRVLNEVLSLWQKIGANDAFEFASGIEDLEIWSGEDASGDGIPDRIVRPEDVTDFDDVVSLNIQLTANSIDPVDGTDLIVRDFGATVKLRNKGL